MDGNDDLPSEFDVIVVGTGMVESIVAASASRIGKNVLHLDRNMYYGDVWATFGLENLEEFIKSYSAPSTSKESSSPPEMDQCVMHRYSLVSSLLASNLAYKWFIPNSLPEEETVKCLEKGESLREGAHEQERQECELKESDAEQDSENKETDSKIDKLSDDKTSESPSLSSEQNSQESQIFNDDTPKEDSDEELHSLDTPGEAGDKAQIVKEEIPEIKQWSVEMLKLLTRKFNIDLVPKVIYSGGPMVELLLRSGVHRYTEFQSVSKILAYIDDCGLEEVPCTKSQVFSCKTFSIIDKRILMKTLNYCVIFDASSEPDYEELKEKTFVEVLKEKKIPDHLINYILYSVAMSTCSTSMLEACSRIKLFFNNVGRYGHSPFLWPLYGSGELLQAFCRLSAVYGGIYYLGRGADSILVSKDTNLCCGIMSNNKQMKAQHIVASTYSCPTDLIDANSPKSTCISRTILFTDRPLREKTLVKVKESIVMLHMLCKDNCSITPVEIIQLPSLTGACPNQMYIVQITCEQREPCWSEVKEVIDKLFIINNYQEPEITQMEKDHPERLIEKLSDQVLKDWFSNTPHQVSDGVSNSNDVEPHKPRILFAFHYEIPNTENISFTEVKPSNLHFCHGPDTSIDFDKAINQAKEIFNQMYPDEEFLEPTPDPNEITLSDLIGEETNGADVAAEDSKSESSTIVNEQNENCTEVNNIETLKQNDLNNDGESAKT